MSAVSAGPAFATPCSFPTSLAQGLRKFVMGDQVGGIRRAGWLARDPLHREKGEPRMASTLLEEEILIRHRPASVRPAGIERPSSGCCSRAGIGLAERGGGGTMFPVSSRPSAPTAAGTLEADPFWRALMAAPVEEGAPPEVELRGVAEAKADGQWVDGATVSAEIAARAGNG